MANFGLSKPWIAKYNETTVGNVTSKSYSDGFQCGRAVSTAITPNYSDAELYADNVQVEYVSEFKNANVTLGLDRLPVAAATVVFGHTVDETAGESKGTETDKGADSASYVGYGFITAEMVDGNKQYRACILTKVKFIEGEESFETKGDTITFSTPNLSGRAMADCDDVWRIKSPYFTTEDAANEWIKTKLNIE